MAHSATAISRNVSYSDWYKTPSPIGEAVYDALKLTVDYYVDPTKSVNGTGTALDPYQPSQAMGVSAGTVCLWTAGTYVGSDPGAGVDNFRTPDLNPTNSGTSGNPIVHIADKAAAYYTSGLTDLRSGATTSGSGWPAFGVNGQDYVYWYGFKSEGNDTNNKAGDDAGVTVLYSADFCRIGWCDIDGDHSHPANNYSGIRMEYADGAKIFANKLSDFDTVGTNHAGIIVYKTNSFDIYNNEIDGSTSGIQLKGASGVDTIHGANIYQNKIWDCDQAFRLHGPVKGPSDELTLIYQNIIYDCVQDFEYTSSGTHTGEQDGLRVFNNVFARCTVGSHRINHDYQSAGDVPRDNQFFNNIHIDCASYLRASYAGASDITHHDNFGTYDRNVIHNTTQFGDGTAASALETLTFSAWQSTWGQDTNSVTSDPTFANDAANDYRLLAGSPALTLGRDNLGQFGSVDATIPCGVFVTGDEYIGVPA